MGEVVKGDALRLRCPCRRSARGLLLGRLRGLVAGSRGSPCISRHHEHFRDPHFNTGSLHPEFACARSRGYIMHSFRIYSIKNYGRHGVVGHHVRFTCGRSPVRTWMVVLIFDSWMVQDAPLIVLKQK